MTVKSTLKTLGIVCAGAGIGAAAACSMRRRVDKEPDAICGGSERGKSTAFAILGRILRAIWDSAWHPLCEVHNGSARKSRLRRVEACVLPDDMNCSVPMR